MTDPFVSRRKEPRYSTSFPVRVVVDGDLAIDGWAKDLSTQGCAIEAETSPGPKAYVKLELTLPDGDPPLEIQLATVRWSHSSLFGIEFIAFGEAQRSRLRRFLDLRESVNLQSI